MSNIHIRVGTEMSRTVDAVTAIDGQAPEHLYCDSIKEIPWTCHDSYMTVSALVGALTRAMEMHPDLADTKVVVDRDFDVSKLDFIRRYYHVNGDEAVLLLGSNER